MKLLIFFSFFFANKKQPIHQKLLFEETLSDFPTFSNVHLPTGKGVIVACLQSNNLYLSETNLHNWQSNCILVGSNITASLYCFVGALSTEEKKTML